MLPIIIAAALGLGLYAVSRLSTSTPTIAYRVAPGGVGRIYGMPDVPIAAAFWVGPEIEVGCRKTAPGKGQAWIAEGARFLPADITVKQPRATLAEALAAEQSAWPFVEWLYRQPLDELTQGVGADQTVTQAEVISAHVLAHALMPWILSEGQASCDVDAFGRPGTPAYNWGRDVLQRVQDFALVRGYAGGR